MTKVQENNDLDLFLVKKIEIILWGEYQQMVAKFLIEAGVSGYTLISHVSGYGHEGFHQGNLLFNEKTAQVIFIAVSDEKTIQKVAHKMRDIFSKNAGVMFISDVYVHRLNYFQSEHKNELP